jgi:hypothetical protein
MLIAPLIVIGVLDQLQAVVALTEAFEPRQIKPSEVLTVIRKAARASLRRRLAQHG